MLDKNWKTSFPTLTFLHERLPDDYVKLSFAIYGERKENALIKLEAIKKFIRSENCRSIELLSYFGQKIRSYH